jgi:aminoglycoside phosphotransferase (APT) family kinase protein
MTDPTKTSRLDEIATLLQPLLGARNGSLRLETRPLRGGLDSAGVSQITARFDAEGRQRSRRLVLKRLVGSQTREARVYAEVLVAMGSSLAPVVTAVRHKPDESWLVLEAIRPISNWPWQDGAMPADVLRTLARLHTSAGTPLVGRSWLSEWDYEAELSARSNDLIRAMERLPRSAEFQRIRERIRSVRRLVAPMPAWRKWLLDFQPFGRTFIHGDVHPGNVMMRKNRGTVKPVLIDWGRSRIGSPMEDVSSWLQSLGYWEPSARQRHDSLLLEYLSARGLPRRLDRELRHAYWLAAASILLAGAINYHLSLLTDPSASVEGRLAAHAAAMDGLRVIRRADECWHSRAL